ncbi:MAG: response regulator [Candidatus Thiodiazotropha sp. (ex Lucinoma kastoroae)]|nr:response regulator [Candidatus Thiodiazotropha sp. (ex Lucinoma kastoroae)]MCU7860183.1 response regulator [Candidatus Thiodiazotropha sp. (ex Lucinoma kastoroae)]
MSKQAFLVDDSKSARIVLSRMLKKSGFDGVEMAVSGEEALERLKEVTPDAIFVDFLMGGIDGLETITEIKKDPRFLATPIVMCTANEGDEYVRAAVDHGALGILAKPPTDESLGEIIDMIERHQQEVAASMAAEAASAEPETTADAETVQTAEPVAIQNVLSDEDVRRIAEEVATQSAERIARQSAEKVVEETVAERVDTTVHAYLDKQLESMVSALVQKGLQSVVPPTAVDSESIRDAVVQQVNQDLDEFVRQLNQRTVEGLIEASVYGQITELADDFSQRMRDQEARILSQVPEKNDMIEHIRVVTEGSLEAHVHQTASQVAGEIANLVATETVESLLDQHLAHQTLENQQSKTGFSGWVYLGLGALVALGVAAFLLYM